MDLVKLGGSVITDKGKLKTFRRQVCDRLAKELGAAKSTLSVVHGAGSFGHIEAKKHGLHLGYKKDSQLHHVATVQRDVRELNLKVLESLIDHDIRAVSIPPASCATFKRGAIKSFDPSCFEGPLEMGLTPVSFGDVVPDESTWFSICSGDLIMGALAWSLKPRLIVFCADVDGVYDSDPKTNKKANLIPALDRATLSSIRRSEATRPDVTGSMHGKLERMLAMAQHCEKCMIVNGNVPGRLEKALRGEKVLSTVVVPE
jgi:isopentenyl phosphate kinase